MKQLIILMMLLIAVPAVGKEHLPFAPKAKYGKVKTKKCKPVRTLRIKKCNWF